MARYVCVSAVYVLTSTVDPLTVSMVLTVRKLVSLAVSVVVFGNTFTVYHVSGTLLVFVGAVAFSYVSASSKPRTSAAGGVPSSGNNPTAAGTPVPVSPGAASPDTRSGRKELGSTAAHTNGVTVRKSQ